MKKFLQGGFWVVLRQFGTRLIGLGVFYVISTLSGPEELGIMGLAWVLVAIADGVFGMGMNVAALRRETLADREASTLFWSLMGQAVIWCLVLYLGAPWVAKAFEAEALVWMVRALGLVFLFRAVQMVPVLMLTRRLALRKLALIDLMAVCLSGAVGIYLAKEGYGAWSLVWRHVVSVAIVTGLAFWVASWKPRLLFSGGVAREFLKFGAPVCLSLNVAWLVELQFQQAMVGTVLGTLVLGLYNYAKKPFDVGAQVLNSVCSSVLVPYLVKRGSGEERDFFMRYTCVSAILVALAGIVFFLGAFAWIESVQFGAGSDWEEAYRLMPLLGLVFCVKAMNVVFRSCHVVLGTASSLSLISVGEAAVSVLAIIVLVGRGIEYVVFASIGANLLSCLLLFATLFRRLEFRKSWVQCERVA